MASAMDIDPVGRDEDEDEVMELQMEDFLELLNDYPQVRDRNFVWSDWFFSSLETPKPESLVASKLKDADNNEESLPLDLTSTDGKDFWRAFSAWLKESVNTSLKRDAIFQAFQKTHLQFVQSMSLDDIERLANGILQQSSPSPSE